MVYFILTFGVTALFALDIYLVFRLFLSSFGLSSILLAVTVLQVVVFFLSLLILRFQILYKKSKKTTRTIAFLHLNADQFGGGEKVLWQVLDVVAGEAKQFKDTEIIIYCAPSKFSDFKTLFERAKEVFAYPFPNLEGNDNIRLCCIPLLRTVYNSRSWPMTLLSMAFSAYIGGIVCCLRNPPHLVIDTAGYPIAFPAFAYFAKAHIAAYIHYPFAYCLQRQLNKHLAPSSIKVLQAGMPDPSSTPQTHEKVSHSSVISRIKRKLSLFGRTQYYRLVQKLYYHSLRYCGLMWVNSSWTKARHIEMIEEVEKRKSVQKGKKDASLKNTKLSDAIRVLYPPCDSEQFLSQLRGQWLKNGYDAPPLPSLDTLSSSSADFLQTEETYSISESLAPYLLPPRSSILSTNVAPQVMSQISFVKDHWNPPHSADSRKPTIVTVGQFRYALSYPDSITTSLLLYSCSSPTCYLFSTHIQT